MSNIMNIAWELYRGSRKNVPFDRREFASCLRFAWRFVKYPPVYVYDTAPAFERGHMYQKLG